jgi:hypothetical protein
MQATRSVIHFPRERGTCRESGEPHRSSLPEEPTRSFHSTKYVRLPRVNPSIRLAEQALVTFLCFGIALNLLLTGATGRLYFWSGRRGSGRIVTTISSPSTRLVFSLLGIAFLILSLYVGSRALAEWAR